MGPRPLAVCILFAASLSARAASAEEPTAAPPEAPAPKKPAPPPYSLPWQLRPAIAATALRLDAAIALQDSATTMASTFLGAYKIVPNFAGLVRLGVVHNAPDHASSASAFANPLLGATFTPELAPGLRLPLFLGATLPVGSGGGNPANTLPGPNGKIAPPPSYAAEGAGIYARSAMDNALFAVNYMAFIVGAGVAYMTHGLTVQAEVTLLQFARIRGSLIDKDETRTNLTSGLHVGYAIVKPLTVSAELRYQRWLSTPAAVVADDTKRDQMTVGVGLRTRVDAVPDKVILRPGVAYVTGVDDPMAKAGYHIIFVDLPVSF